jgi:hypothetical protein
LVSVRELERRHNLLDRTLNQHWDRVRLRAEIQELHQAAEPRVLQDVRRRVEIVDDPDDAENLLDFPDIVEDAMPPGLQNSIDRPSDLSVRIERVTRDLKSVSLERRLAELDKVLAQLRPWQLTPRDDEALRELFLVVHGDGVQTAVLSLTKTLGRLARASRERRLMMPTIQEAEAVVRLGRARARR